MKTQCTIVQPIRFCKMKNLKYFPCERNRYFYGKLLGVEDFELEQKYMNDKRRLINRFMHGCGVVCGLNVIPVGPDAVSVEAGLALDFAGREKGTDTDPQAGIFPYQEYYCHGVSDSAA